VLSSVTLHACDIRDFADATLHAVDDTVFDSDSMWTHVSCTNPSYFTHNVPLITRYTLHVSTSRVTRHTSHVTRHTSHVTRLKVTPIPRRVLGGFSSQTPLTTSATAPSPMASAARLDDCTASGGSAAKADTAELRESQSMCNFCSIN
jgi:hypothetical protein